MKIPTISLKRTLEVTMNDASKRLMELDGLDKKALTEEYKEWIQASEGSKAVSYTHLTLPTKRIV